METDPVFRPAVGDIVRKGQHEYATCGVILSVYEDVVGGRLYLVQMNRAALLLKGPDRLTQHEFDTLGFQPATQAEWQQNMREVEAWYASEKKKLLAAVDPYVDLKTDPQE